MKIDLSKAYNAAIYYKKLLSDELHADNALKICYSKFWKYASNNKELAALYLMQYLTSYGMFRGSSTLSDKNFRILLPLVGILKKEEYFSLKRIKISSLDKPGFLESILKLSNDIDLTLIKSIDKNKYDRKYYPSDTLITKIMLGVFGCSLAYDTYVKNGLRVAKADSLTLNKVSLNEIKNNQPEINEIIKEFKKVGIDGYSDFRYLDMYFWYTGFKSKKSKK